MGLLERLEKQKNPQQSEISADNPARGSAVYVDEYSVIKDQIHGEIIELVNQEAVEGGKTESNDEAHLLQSIENLVDTKAGQIPRTERSRLVKEIYNNVIGLGPLEPLLADPTISEIMVNGPYCVYVERAGKLELSATKFKDNEHVMNVLNRHCFFCWPPH